MFTVNLLLLFSIISEVMIENVASEASKRIVKEFSKFLSVSDNSSLDLKDIVHVNKGINPFPDFCALRIAGGEKGDLKYVPYQISLVVQNTKKYFVPICGGALITLDHIISAAHCFTSSRSHYSKLYAIAGALNSYHEWMDVELKDFKDDTQYRKIDKLYIHINFVYEILKNDVAVLTVSPGYKKSEKVQPIRLHTNHSEVLLKPGTQCLVSGYGMINQVQTSDYLKMVCVPLLSKAVCEKRFAQLFRESNLCAGAYGKDSCLGDSGGPFVCQGILVGIVSFGDRCGYSPGVYAKVLSYTANDNSDIPMDESDNVMMRQNAINCHGVAHVCIFVTAFLGLVLIGG